MHNHRVIAQTLHSAPQHDCHHLFGRGDAAAAAPPWNHMSEVFSPFLNSETFHFYVYMNLFLLITTIFETLN